MALNIPPGIPGAGAVSVVFVPGGVAAPTGPKLTEVNATGSSIISCVLMSDGFTQTASQTTAKARRLCSSAQYDIPGPIDRAFNALKYIYDPQGVTTDAANKAYTGLAEGATGDLIVRWGLPGTQDFAIGDKVDVWSVRLGPKNKETPGDSDELQVTQGVFWTGTYHPDVAMVA